MGLIPTRIHGMIDYAMGALLIVAPWLLGFAAGGAETWIPVILGIAVIVYSLLTDYELGVVRGIPMATHRAWTPRPVCSSPSRPGCSASRGSSSSPT